MIERLLGPLSRKAWPNPPADRLLRAALLQDRGAAASAWREYEAMANFDRLTSAEMRLIGLASRRLGALSPDSPMRARIGGIERANWSRSQLTIGEAGSGLSALAAAQVAVLAIRGAARVAGGGAWARGRPLSRVDVALRPVDMEKAFDLLTEDGWQPAGTGTTIYQRARLADVIGLDFVRGQFGRIGVHRTAFRPLHASPAEDASVWQRSLAGRLAEAPVRLPSATDAIAMALAEGIRDTEDGADRLADIALGVEAGVDWDLLQYLADRRRLHAPATVGLRYVRERLERPVPGSVLRRMERGAIRHPLALFAAVSKPRRTSGAAHSFRLALAAAWQGRYFGLRRRVVFPSLFLPDAEVGHGTGVDSDAGALEQDLPIPDRRLAETWNGTIDLAISVGLPPVPRRLDFEVNSAIGHHVRLTALVRNRGRRSRLLRFRFPIRLLPEEGTLVLVAAASRNLAADAPQTAMDRYGARPFKLVHLRTREVARQ